MSFEGHDQVETVIRRIRESMREVHRNVTVFQVGRDEIEQNLSLLEGILVQVLRLENLFNGGQQVLYERLLAYIQRYRSQLREMLNTTEPTTPMFQARRLSNGQRGPPKYEMLVEQLEFLIIDLRFSASKVATLLGVSLSTLRRHMRAYDISCQSLYARITDVQLDDLVQDITRDNPRLGYRMVHAELAGRGYRVQIRRVRDSQVRVDAEAVALRWGSTVKRRVYSVATPNSLWHIDGNHKLIRWKFIIHGGIDGYSRLVVYLSVATNNCSSTVLERFMEATRAYGVPARVRMDYGVENRDVAKFMLQYRGTQCGCVITGKSVHNQRIERLWRDVFVGVLATYYNLFVFLEEESLLDVDNDYHMYCLHYVFLPRLQMKVKEFTEMFNEHGVSTEGMLTPKQLFTAGILLNRDSGHTGVSSIFHEGISRQDWENYGIDDNGPIPTPANHEPNAEEPSYTIIEVPQVQCPFSEAEILQIKTEFDEKVTDSSFDPLGLSLYQEVIEFVRNISH